MNKLYEIRLPDLDGKPRWRRCGMTKGNAQHVLLGLEPEDTDFAELYEDLKTLELIKGEDVWNYRPLMEIYVDDQPPEAA